MGNWCSCCCSTSSSSTGSGDASPAKPPISADCDNKKQGSKEEPHKFYEIIAQEKSAASDELKDKVNSGKGIYLAAKTKKYWLHEKTRCNCFMLFPRGLSITWGEDSRYWSWQRLKEGDAEIEVVSLLNVCHLEIKGKLELSHLTPGVDYEVVFEVMLTGEAYGWSIPVNLQLKLPDGTVQGQKEKLLEKPWDQWLQLKAGEVTAQQGQKGEMEISMFEYGGHWKKGLLIKGIKIAPKE